MSGDAVHDEGHGNSRGQLIEGAPEKVQALLHFDLYNRVIRGTKMCLRECLDPLDWWFRAGSDSTARIALQNQQNS
jgi:hypothetical protein